MNKKQEVIELLKKVSANLWAYTSPNVAVKNEKLSNDKADIDQAIALLKQPSYLRLGSMSMHPKPKCDTCGGSKRKPRKKHCKMTYCVKNHASITCCPNGKDCEYYIPSEPCPSCTEKPISMAVAVDDCDITDKPSVPEGYLLIKAKSFMGKLEKCNSCDTDKTDCEKCWQNECYQEPVEKPPESEIEAIELDKMCVSELVAKYESSHNAITVLKRKLREAYESDDWMKKATEFYQNGGCPICFSTDEAGCKEGCYFGQLQRQVDEIEKPPAKTLENDSGRLIATLEITLNKLNEIIEQQAERIEVLEAGLTKIDNWAKAYPLKVFPEPDFKKIAQVLKTAGISLDAITASNMRHVINGVKNIVEQALKVKDDNNA